MAKMEIIELLIDETKLETGINAVSIVESPAIEENFVALNKHEVELKEVDTEKRILMGAALVPNKQIYRRVKDKEFYIFFSEETVRKASELFLMRSNQNNATLEHEKKMLDGMSVVESWIIEDEKTDKSRLYNFNLPKGTWMISMKVNNDEIWNKVKAGDVKGFSIEGYFVDKYEMSLQVDEEQEMIERLKQLILEHETKTNLGKHKIDLGIADKALKAFDSFMNNQLQNTIDLKTQLDDSIKKYNKKVDDTTKKFREIEKGEYLTAYTQITEMARELGVAPIEVPQLKELERKYSFNGQYVRDLKKIIVNE